MAQQASLSYPFEARPLDLFVRRLAAHSELSSDAREALSTLPATRMEVGPHREIVRLGETVDHACLVHRGLVGRFGQTHSGARQFVSVHVPGEMVDLYSLMAPRTTSALMALTRSTVFQVPHRALRDVAHRFPAVSDALWRDCVLQGAIVVQWLVNVGRRDARSRMAHFICEMAVRRGHGPGDSAVRFELPLTQEQLGDLLGLTAVHVNRTLMALRREQLMTFAKGYVEILEWTALAAAGDFDPSYLAGEKPKVQLPASRVTASMTRPASAGFSNL